MWYEAVLGSMPVLLPTLVPVDKRPSTHTQAASVRYKEVLQGELNNFTSPSLGGMSPVWS